MPEVVAVLNQAQLFIGNDSGLMHMAAASGAPTIGLFGPTDAAVYQPAGRAAIAVVADTMQALRADDVLGAAIRLLNSAKLDGPARPATVSTQS